jgi:hypothetical protein
VAEEKVRPPVALSYSKFMIDQIQWNFIHDWYLSSKYHVFSILFP